MNKAKLFSAALIFSLAIISCGPSIKTTGSWVNKEKLPAEPVKSVFIIAFTDNMEARAYLEEDLALAAEKKGLKTYKSIDVIGPVDIKYIAPVKDAFMKKLETLNCETIFTVALVNSESETKYVSGTTITATGYSPYAYGSYAGYGGYGPHGDYGGFGGYYGYAVSTMSTAGYYKTDNKYFLEAKMFDLKTEELLFSIQTEATNPAAIQKSSKEYTLAVMEEIKKLNLQKK
jgi:hypothetical protein